MKKVKRNNDDVFQDGFTTALLISRSGGWATIQTKDGKTYKYRSGQVIEVPDNTPDEAPDLLSVPAELRHLIPAKAVEAPKLPKARCAIRIGKVEVPLGRYQTIKEVRTASGRASVDNADSVAEKLRGLPLIRVYEIVSEALGMGLPDLQARYEHLNAGMQRMNLGNLLRKASRK